MMDTNDTSASSSLDIPIVKSAKLVTPSNKKDKKIKFTGR